MCCSLCGRCDREPSRALTMKRSTLNLAILLCSLFVSQAASLDDRRTLTRRQVLDAKQRGALCNDFSPSIYYLDRSDVSRWVVYFEGGGGCSSMEECNERYTEGNLRNRPLMSSLEYPDAVKGEDLLSGDSDHNPFHNYSHVLVPYCSSDAWLANRSNPQFDSGADFTFDASSDNFIFKGAVIFRSVMEDLMSQGLGDATELVLAGSSAGGLAVLNHLGWVRRQLENTSVFVLIDSAWFLPYNGYHAVNWTREVAQSFGIHSEACLDTSLGFPCCTSPGCLIAKDYIDTTQVPVFAVSSIYDIYTFQDALQQQLGASASLDNDQSLLRHFNMYGAIVNQSTAQSYIAHGNLSLYTPSCTQHVYLATSSLWGEEEEGGSGGLLNQTMPGMFRDGAFELTNPIRSGNWDRVSIRSLTLRRAIEIWHGGGGVAQTYTTDSCGGPVCGQCPGAISLVPYRNIWPTWANVIVLFLSALFTAIPVVMKLGVYVHVKYMLYRQKVYAFEVGHYCKARPNFPKASQAINVSCTGLFYRIDVVNGPKLSMQSAPVTHRTQEQFDTYAKMESFLPCFKNVWSRCLPRTTSTHSNTNGIAHDPLLTQSDSGISSIHRSPQASPDEDIDTIHSMDLESLVTTRTNVTKNWGKKAILSQVNLYVNPGELVAVMGPSGSGKTTLLDVVLGKRTSGNTEGDIFINGQPLTSMRHWFVQNTGYVRQLATSFYNELTVRENLLFSMNMQAPPAMTLEQRLERVEQVIKETGLSEQADVTVGTGMGLGLSGGQRKRLAIAVQLLSMPNIMFLDEPTSGLDSASSLEILKSLQALAETGRAIVITIHQPRSEIFHTFDKMLLLCNGRVAFFGSPVMVWNFFVGALNITNEDMEESERKALSVSMSVAQNPADAILDRLKESDTQRKVLRAYQESGEPRRVRQAILDSKATTEPSYSAASSYPGFWHRLVSLEARASLRQNIFAIIYLPIVYLVFGIILSTTYLFTSYAVQIMSVTCLISCSSSLFMSSIIMSLLLEPLKLFRLEHSDGIALPHELVLQVFIRMSCLCTLPLAVSSTLVFGLVYQNYRFDVYVIVLLTFFLVNQAWLALFILLTVSYPSQAHRLCPVFAAGGGFCCGFIVPIQLMPPYYRWIFYINPSYWAYAATTVSVLDGNDLPCSRGSVLECFRETGYAVLSQFGLEDVNPALSLVVLMVMVVLFVVLAIAMLWLSVNLPFLKQSAAELYLVIGRCRKTTGRGRVHSALQTVVPEPMAPTKVSATNPTAIEETDGLPREEGMEFLESGSHKLFTKFPWERTEDQDDADGDVFLLTPVIPDRMRLPSVPRVTLTSDDDASSMHSEIAINMEDQGEDERRRLADLKFFQRRQRMESEFLRLKHNSENHRRAQRHSVTLCNNLGREDQQRVQSSQVWEAPRDRAAVNRSASVPADPDEDAPLNPLRRMPTLETLDEEMIPGLDQHLLGLPPKDMSHLDDSSEHVERLVVGDIPGELVDMKEWSDSQDDSDLESSV